MRFGLRWWFLYSGFLAFGLGGFALGEEGEDELLEEGFELPKLDELIDLGESEPADPLREGDTQALLQQFREQHGLDILPEVPNVPVPFALPEEPAKNPQLERQARGLEFQRLVIHSGDELLFVAAPAPIASDLLRLSDSLRKRLGAILGEDSTQRYPCLIEFHDLPALSGEPISALRIRAYEGMSYRVELALRDGDGFDAIALQRLLVRMLLLERIAQGALAQEPETMPVVPDWLVTGMAELIRFRSGRLDPREFRQALQAGVQVELVEVLAYQNREQSTGLKRLHELGCLALVHSLLEQGESRFLNWLGKSLKQPQQQEQELVNFFVSYGFEDEELVKRYRASWIQLSQSTALQRYSASESRQVLLANLVSVSAADEQIVETAPGLSVAECLAQWEEADLVLVRYWQQVLLALQERVHPLFGGVVIRSRRMFEGLAEGSVNLEQARQQWQAELREMEVIVSMMERVELRLNEYQLNFGAGEAAWIEQLARNPAFDRSRSLLPRRGQLQRRLDWAEEKWRLEQAKQNLPALEQVQGLEELEEVLAE